MHFSFFGSHVNLILEPNQNFRNLREYIEYLPLDYYILMQKGYREKKKVDFKTTNSILVSNLPLLAKKNTYFKKTLNMKTIFYEDVYRCNSRSEAFELLSESEAEKAMTEHIESKFGSVAEFETFSYDMEAILNKLGFTKTMGMAADENMIDEGDNFD